METLVLPHEDISLDISDEQAEILDALSRGECVKGTALPGCGKSKLIEEIIRAFPERNIITLSYNSKLVRTSNERVQKMFAQIGRQDAAVCIKTLHSLLSSLIKENIHNDLLFSEALRCMNFALLGSNWMYKDFDLLIIDEAQDLRLPYVRFLIKLIVQVCTNRPNLQIVLLGDPMQELYGFYPINKADARFLTLAEDIFGGLFPTRTWYHAQLSVSYRVTPQMANFVNALAPSRHMVSGKENKSKITNWVTLYILDVYRDAAQTVYDIIKREGAKNRGKIMLLCSSLNENSPVQRIVDLLVANGISVYVKRSGSLADGARLDTVTIGNCNCGDDMANKVCCDTCCGAKGLQQDIVIFLNMCELLCPNLLTNQQYVALTRGKKRLYIIQHAFYTSQSQVDALIKNPNIRQRDLRIIQKRPIVMQLKPKESRITKKENLHNKHALAVKTLFAFLDVEHLENLVKYVDYSIVIAGLHDTHEDNNLEEDFIEESEYATPCANYIADMTLSFDDAVTHINVTNICSMALQLMVEFAFTRRTPVFISQILHKIGFDMDPKFALMRNIIHDVIDMLEATSAKKKMEDSGITTFVLENAECFGKIAVVHDAFYGFRENLYAITNFDFCHHPQVETRFIMLCDSVDKVLSEHSLQPEDCVWHQEKTGRFLHEGEPVQIKACPAIRCKNVIVTFTNNTATSHDDRFCGIVSAIIASDGDEMLSHTELYVMNVFDASTQKICLIDPISMQPQTNDTTVQNSPLKRARDTDIVDMSLSKKLCLNISDDVKELPANAQTLLLKRERDEDAVEESQLKRVCPNINEIRNAATSSFVLQRRKACPFLKSAISFKTWQQDEDAQSSSGNEEESNEAFVARMHAEIRQIEREEQGHYPNRPKNIDQCIQATQHEDSEFDIAGYDE